MNAIVDALWRAYRIRHVDMVSILVFEPDGSVVPIAGRLPLDAPVTVGHPLPAARAAYLRESATGPWIDEWTPGRADDDYTRRWLEMGPRRRGLMLSGWRWRRKCSFASAPARRPRHGRRLYSATVTVLRKILLPLSNQTRF